MPGLALISLTAIDMAKYVEVPTGRTPATGGAIVNRAARWYSIHGIRSNSFVLHDWPRAVHGKCDTKQMTCGVCLE